MLTAIAQDHRPFNAHVRKLSFERGLPFSLLEHQDHQRPSVRGGQTPAFATVPSKALIAAGQSVCSFICPSAREEAHPMSNTAQPKTIARIVPRLNSQRADIASLFQRENARRAFDVPYWTFEIVHGEGSLRPSSAGDFSARRPCRVEERGDFCAAPDFLRTIDSTLVPPEGAIPGMPALPDVAVHI
jgi:hypothetical protein